MSWRNTREFQLGAQHEDARDGVLGPGSAAEAHLAQYTISLESASAADDRYPPDASSALVEDYAY
jgi:hypothetical protein